MSDISMSDDLMSHPVEEEPLPVLNVDLLSQIIKWAEVSAVEDPEPSFPGWGQWRQRFWFERTTRMAQRNEWPENSCGTTMCMAGQAAYQAGWLPHFEGQDYVRSSECYPRGQENTPDTRRPVSEVGAEVLGLTHWEAKAMFNGSNNLREVKAAANWAYAARGLGCPYPDVDTPDRYEFEDWCERADA